jgi:hypothetical protein
MLEEKIVSNLRIREEPAHCGNNDPLCNVRMSLRLKDVYKFYIHTYWTEL